MCFQFTCYPCDDWENLYTLCYYHHQIGSMNYDPLFRVRSWNHGMSFYILMISMGLVQERCNSFANALGLRLSCTNPSIWSQDHLLCCKILSLMTLPRVRSVDREPIVYDNNEPTRMQTCDDDTCLLCTLRRMLVTGKPFQFCTWNIAHKFCSGWGGAGCRTERMLH